MEMPPCRDLVASYDVPERRLQVQVDDVATLMFATATMLTALSKLVMSVKALRKTGGTREGEG
jgi:hypothetical protein